MSRRPRTPERWSVAVLGAIAMACGGPSADVVAKSDAKAQRVVEVVPVTARILEATVRLPGELTAYQAVAIYPRVGAFVEAMLVDRGWRVKRGDVLARLSAPELVAQRAEAEAKASADASTFERLRAASRTAGAVAGNDLDLAQKAMQADEERVRALRTLEDYLTLTAPFDGIVTERDVHPGALVGPSGAVNAMPMLRLEHVDELRLTVAVPEAHVGAIAEGATAEFAVQAWPGERFTGVIRRIARSLEVRTRSMPVELDVDNRDGRLAPGMFADVAWPVRRTVPSLFVPSSAVVQTAERVFVDRVRDGRVERVPVDRGVGMGDQVEVFGPLRAGEMVAKRGSEELRDGDRVEARESPADAAAAPAR